MGSRKSRKRHMSRKRRSSPPARGQRRGVSRPEAPSPPAPPPPAQPPVQPSWLVYFGVIACFFLSGLAALLYQTAWLQAVFAGVRHQRARRRHGAGRLHGRAGAGLGGGRALRRARHPTGAGLRPARGRDRPVGAGGAAAAAGGPGALRVDTGRAAGAAGRGRHRPAGLLPAGGVRGAGRSHELHGRHAAAADPLRRAHRRRSGAEGGAAVCHQHRRGGGAARWPPPSCCCRRSGLNRTVWVGVAVNALVFVIAAALARGRRDSVAGEADGGGRARGGGGPPGFVEACIRPLFERAAPLRERLAAAVPHPAWVDAAADAGLRRQRVSLRSALDPDAGPCDRRQHLCLRHDAGGVPHRHRAGRRPWRARWRSGASGPRWRSRSRRRPLACSPSGSTPGWGC